MSTYSDKTTTPPVIGYPWIVSTPTPEKISVTYRSVIHVFARHGEYVRHRKHHAYEECPEDTRYIHRPTKPTSPHIKRARLELYLGVMFVQPSPGGLISSLSWPQGKVKSDAQEDRDNV